MLDNIYHVRLLLPPPAGAIPYPSTTAEEATSQGCIPKCIVRNDFVVSRLRFVELTTDASQMAQMHFQDYFINNQAWASSLPSVARSAVY